MKTFQLSSLLLLGLLFSTVHSTYAQRSLLQSNSTFARTHSITVDEADWIHFDNPKSAETVIADLLSDKKNLGLSGFDQLRIVGGADLKSYTNQSRKSDTEFIKVQQYINGVRVEGGEMKIFLDNQGQVYLMHGKLARGISPKTIAISKQAALTSAVKYLKFEKYAWQDPRFESQIRKENKDSSATYYPSAELVYTQKELIGSYDESNIALTYKFTVVSIAPQIQATDVYVDVQSGEVVRSSSNVRNAWGTIPATLHDGYRNFTTRARAWPQNDYILRSDWIHTHHWVSGNTGWWLQSEVDDANNIWDNSSQIAAASAHWAAETAWDYYLSKFGRNGMNGSGRTVRVEATSSIENGVYREYNGDDYITVGKSGPGVPNGNLATLDLVGHEFTHGVVQHTSELDFTSESFALDESFGDIFGTMVEAWVYGTVDWKIPDNTGYVWRNMEDPASKNHPTHYQGTNWSSSGEPHINAGPQNRWFYLLSQGGSGVVGIGINDAAKIAYRNMTVMLSANSKYIDARSGAIAAAKFLFGDCSVQYTSTINAWNAVGVGAAAQPCFGEINPASLMFCLEHNSYQASFAIKYYPASASLTWIVPSQWIYTTSPNTLSLTGISNPTSAYYTLIARVNHNGTNYDRYSYVQVKACNAPCPGGICPELRVEPESKQQEEVDAATLDTAKEAAFIVSPNPAKGNVTIRLPINREAIKEEDSIITIWDGKGNQVIRVKSPGNDLSLDLTSLAPGLYLIVITNGSGTSVEKLIVQH